MDSLFIRRALVWGFSTVLGVLTTMLFLYLLLPAVSPNVNEGTISIGRYGIQYFFWTAFPFTLVFVTIFDAFAETRIWPD